MAPPSEEDALFELYYLSNSSTKNWRKLLKYGETLDLQLKRKILWIWPTEKCLWQINNVLRDAGITCVLSIGCGSGLFEWLLKESLNLQIYGLEVDRQWWQSDYAIKNFIDLAYVEDLSPANEEDFLKKCCERKNWNFALMFCYFNNRTAFTQYLSIFKGKWLIIIGPAAKKDVYTDPLPLEPNIPCDANTKWLKRASLALGEHDILVTYEKCLVRDSET